MAAKSPTNELIKQLKAFIDRSSRKKPKLFFIIISQARASSYIESPKRASQPARSVIAAGRVTGVRAFIRGPVRTWSDSDVAQLPHSEEERRESKTELEKQKNWSGIDSQTNQVSELAVFLYLFETENPPSICLYAYIERGISLSGQYNFDSFANLWRSFGSVFVVKSALSYQQMWLYWCCGCWWQFALEQFSDHQRGCLQRECYSVGFLCLNETCKKLLIIINIVYEKNNCKSSSADRLPQTQKSKNGIQLEQLNCRKQKIPVRLPNLIKIFVKKRPAKA